MDISLLYSALAMKAEQDPAFRTRLLEDCSAVLAELGIALPEGLHLHVVENTPTVKYFVLPPRPDLPAAARWSTEDATNLYGSLVAQTWNSPTYKARLLAEPKAALREAGLDVNDALEIRVVERTATDAWLVLPATPKAPAQP